MNENKHYEDETQEKEPLTKRIAKFSAFIYLGLAIIVVVVATVGIFSISYDYDSELPAVSFPDMNLGTDFSVPEIQITPEQNISKPDEKPVIKDESDVGAEVEKPDEQETPRQMFYRPVNGEIMKSHSLDKLVFSETMGDYRVHSGVDIAAQLGDKVLAYSDGIIASVENDYFYGMTVAISHADGVVSYYKNLDATLAENITVGAEILAGAEIGTVGNTARIENADEPHLHFELTVNGVPVDPKNELPNIS